MSLFERYTEWNSRAENELRTLNQRGIEVTNEGENFHIVKEVHGGTIEITLNCDDLYYLYEYSDAKVEADLLRKKAVEERISNGKN